MFSPKIKGFEGLLFFFSAGERRRLRKGVLAMVTMHAAI